MSVVRTVIRTVTQYRTVTRNNGIPGTGGGSGVDTYVELLDKASANLPTINTPLATALAGKSATSHNHAGVYDPAGSAAAAQAFAIDRANHTGTQAQSTVTNLVSDLAGKETSGAAASAQAYAVQRANHTGTQAQSTITNLVSDLASKASSSSLTAHTSDTANPHAVTKAQVGLGNADNTSDASKPVSTATQTALDAKANLTGGNTITGAQTIEHSANPVLDLRRTTSGTSSIAATGSITAISSGDAADGFGPTIGFRISDTGVTNELIGAIGVVRAGADNTGDIVFRPQVAGTATERLRVTSAGDLVLSGVSSTGSGANVRAISPTLVTPNLGTPSAINLTNGTALPVGGISATGTPSSSTYLRGDGTWNTPSGGSTYTGTANQVIVTGTVLSTPQDIATTSTVTFGTLTLGTNSSASTPSARMTGTIFTGGTATTTKPHFLIEPTGATSTAWNTNGTVFAVNPGSGYGGNLVDFQVNGSSKFKVDQFGVVTTTSAMTIAGSLSGVTNLTVSGYLAGTPQALSGAGAVNVSTLSTAYTSTGVGQALTLANGTVNGQIKTIAHVSRGSGTGTGILTPTTANGFTTITFTGTGAAVVLQYFTTGGWVVLGSNANATVA